MMIKLFLILIITVCDGKIKITITASNFINNTDIKYKGSDIKQVTDKEVELFNITNENLNRGIKVEMGKVPDEVFLRDPTKYGDVFNKFHWPDVRRKLSVRNITIVEFIKEDVVLNNNVLINNTTVSIKTKSVVVKEVSNTVTAIWNNGGLPDDEICYEVSIDFEYGNVLHEAVWRDANTTNFDMIVKKSTGVMEIQPGKRIVTKLLAEKIILLVKIEFDAHLIGNVVANYAKVYGKYHLWSPTIGNIMRAAILKNKLTTTLLLEVRYHANTRLEVVDKDTGQVMTNEDYEIKSKRKIKFYLSKKSS